jgi:hypothetical protein
VGFFVVPGGWKLVPDEAMTLGSALCVACRSFRDEADASKRRNASDYKLWRLHEEGERILNLRKFQKF